VAHDTGAESLLDELAPLVPVTSTLREMRTIKSFMEKGESFILVGPEGCGKTLMVGHLLSDLRNVAISILHCNAQTTSLNLLQKLQMVTVS